MQILHPFAGSIQSYAEEISDPNRYRPDHCPQCEANHPLTGHGFYFRTLVAAARAAAPAGMPYQRGQFWVRRFRKQAPTLSLALPPLVATIAAADFVSRALRMLESIGWIAAHRFLFSQLRAHLLGWPACLAPAGRRITLAAACPTS